MKGSPFGDKWLGIRNARLPPQLLFPVARDAGLGLIGTFESLPRGDACADSNQSTGYEQKMTASRGHRQVAFHHIRGSAGFVFVVLMIVAGVGRQVLAVADLVLHTNAVGLAFLDPMRFTPDLGTCLATLTVDTHFARIIDGDAAKVRQRGVTRTSEATITRFSLPPDVE